MKQTEKMIQALLTIDKIAMKARKQGGLGTPTIPVYVLSGEKLKPELLQNFSKRAEIKDLQGEPLVLAGTLLDGKNPTGFLFTTVGVYPSKDVLTANREKVRLPIAYQKLECVTQDRKTGNYNCTLVYRTGEKIQVFANIYGCWFTEAMSRLLPLAEAVVQQPAPALERKPEEESSSAVTGEVPAKKPAAKEEPKPEKAKPAPDHQPEAAPKQESVRAEQAETVSREEYWAAEKRKIHELLRELREDWEQEETAERSAAAPKAYRGKDSYGAEELCRYAMEFLKEGRREEAAELYRCAVALGSDEACFRLGMLYLDHQLPEDHTYDLHRAHGLILEAASKGHADALALAREINFVEEDFYNDTVPEEWVDYGIGGKQDHLAALEALKQNQLNEAVRLLKQSVDKGWEKAMYLLGRLHLSCRYDFCDPLVGSALLHRCCLRGNTEARKVLKTAFPPAKVIPVKPAAAGERPAPADEDLILLAQALEEEKPELADSMYNAICDRHAGACYTMVLRTSERRPEQTGSYLRKALELGSEGAKTWNRALFHLEVSQKQRSAWDHMELVEQALGSGNDVGELGALARFLLEGRDGVPCYEKGIYYLRRAMDLNPIYVSLMAEYYKQSWLDPSDRKPKRWFWLRRGAEKGSSTCMAMLAEYYGVPGPNHDPSWSRFWAKECWEKTKDDNEKRVAAFYLSCHGKDAAERAQWKSIYNGLQ